MGSRAVGGEGCPPLTDLCRASAFSSSAASSPSCLAMRYESYVFSLVTSLSTTTNGGKVSSSVAVSASTSRIAWS